MYKQLETIVYETLAEYGNGNLESDACRKKIAKEVSERYEESRRVPDERWSK